MQKSSQSSHKPKPVVIHKFSRRVKNGINYRGTTQSLLFDFINYYRLKNRFIRSLGSSQEVGLQNTNELRCNKSRCSIS